MRNRRASYVHRPTQVEAFYYDGSDEATDELMLLPDLIYWSHMSVSIHNGRVRIGSKYSSIPVNPGNYVVLDRETNTVHVMTDFEFENSYCLYNET